MKHLTKVAATTVALAGSLSILLAGCGTSGSTSSAGNNTTSSAGTPVNGGTLTLAQGTKYDDQFIPDMDASLYTMNITQMAFDPLLNIDNKMNFVPDLVQSYSWSNDKKTLTMTLDPKANWTDGQPVTSADVLFTMNYLASKVYNTTLQGQYGYLVGPVKGSSKIMNGTATSFAQTGGFTQVNDKTFELHFDKPDAAVLYADIASIQPVPSHILKDIPIAQWQTSSFNKMPTVTDGAYKFTQVNGQDNVQMTANANYFRGNPHITNLVIKTVTPDVLPGELANGDVQMNIDSGAIKPQDVSKLKQIPGLTVKPIVDNGFSYLGLKLYKPEFQNVKVRQAIEYALNRPQMIQGIMKGYATPVSGPLPPVSWAYATPQDGMNLYNYNPTQANQLLDEAGWKKGANGMRIDPSTGQEANLHLSYSSGNPTTQAEAVAIQQYLQAVGLKVTLDSPMDFNTLAQKVETNDKSIQMWLMAWSLSVDPDPRGLWDSTDAMNFERWKDPHNDQLIADTWGAKAFDQSYRKQAFINWQLYVNQQMPLNFLWARDDIYAYSNKLHIPANDWSSAGVLNPQQWWLQQ